MPFINLDNNESKIELVDNSPSNPLGKRARFLFDTRGYGVPRAADLFTPIKLQQTGIGSIMNSTIKSQITTQPWTLKPLDEEEADSVVYDAIDDGTRFFEGGFNFNSESFDHLLKKHVDGVLAYDAGIFELVPDEDGYLAEIYNRPGITFTKNPDEFDRLPRPPEPAYYQFGMSNYSQNVFDGEKGSVWDLIDSVRSFQGFHVQTQKPQGFTRDQIVWTEENPSEVGVYGVGRFQKVARELQILLREDRQNLKWYSENEFPKGILQITGIDKGSIEDFKEQWKNNYRGRQHKLPISPNEVKFEPLIPDPQAMQFLQSQEWYLKRVAMAFGLTETEIGNFDNANKAISEHNEAMVYRKTTKPLLRLIEQQINTEILPYTRFYERAEGNMRFEFDTHNPKVEKMLLEILEKKQNMGVVHINEVRNELGRETVPWGDVPVEAVRSQARENPNWFFEMAGMDADELPEDDPDPFALGNSVSSVDQLNDCEDGLKKKIVSFKNALLNAEKVNERFDKEALRNQRGGRFTPLVGHMESVKGEVSSVLKNSLNPLFDLLEDEFPEEKKLDKGFLEKRLLPDVDRILDGLDLRDSLFAVLSESNVEAMEKSAEHDESVLRQLIEEGVDVPDEVDLDLSVDLGDSYAVEVLRRNTSSRVVQVEGTVGEMVRNELLEAAEDEVALDEAVNRLEERVDSISENHAELIARTETMDAAREGAQAFSEQSDLVDGNEWLATNDGRVRPWHEAMDGVKKRVDEDFVVPSGWQGKPFYQPDDYPRSARKVGDDQPWNCRCDQLPVLPEDMPDDLVQLSKDFDCVSFDGLTEKQYRIYKRFKEDCESSFEVVWRRLCSGVSMNKLSDLTGLSKNTVYRWSKDLGVR